MEARRLTIPILNRILAEKGYPFEFVKGDGYWYFQTDESLPFDTHSVYAVARINDLSLAAWLFEADTFLRRLNA